MRTQERRFQATRFVKGNVVKLLGRACQGLDPALTYSVTEVLQKWTPFGTFVSYELTDHNGTARWIENGHLILTEAR